MVTYLAGITGGFVLGWMFCLAANRKVERHYQDLRGALLSAIEWLELFEANFSTCKSPQITQELERLNDVLDRRG